MSSELDASFSVESRFRCRSLALYYSTENLDLTLIKFYVKFYVYLIVKYKNSYCCWFRQTLNFLKFKVSSRLTFDTIFSVELQAHRWQLSINPKVLLSFTSSREKERERTKCRSLWSGKFQREQTALTQAGWKVCYPFTSVFVSSASSVVITNFTIKRVKA